MRIQGASGLAAIAARWATWDRVAGFGREIKSFAVRQPLGAFGATIIILMIIAGIFAPQFAPQDPYQTNRYADDEQTVKAPFLGLGETGYVLGADHLGRDVLSRLIYGARISLYVGLVATAIGVGIGSLLGMISATAPGWVDLILQRFVDALMAFPGIILALAIMATLGSSLQNVIIAITISLVAFSARTLRSQALSIRGMDYVLAARAVGAGYWRILFVHIAPNCLALIAILASVTLGAAIIIESTLSFLGLGAPPEEPSWGGMITGGGQTYRFLRVAPHLVWLPAITIGLAVFAFNMLGDALRDMWDPRLRGSR